MQRDVEQAAERTRRLAENLRQPRNFRDLGTTFADHVHLAATAGHEHVAAWHERNPPRVIDRFRDNAHLEAVRPVAVFPRTVTECTAAARRRRCASLLLTAAAALPAATTTSLARGGAGGRCLLRDTVETGKHHE